MKKLFSCILAILILTFSVVPCFAEEEKTTTSASLSISASSTAVNVGDTIKLTVKVSEGLGTIDFSVKYSSECFSYDGDASGGTFVNYEPSSGTAGTFSCRAYENESGAGGTVSTITLKVNKVPTGNGTTISVTATGYDNERNKVTVSGSSVTIKCAHKETEKVEVKPSTCSEAGKTEEKCKICGTTGLNPTEIAKLPHSYGEWEIVEMPTQYTQGKQKRVCADCGYIDIQPVNVNGENPNESETNTEFPSYPFYQEEENEYNTTPTPKPNNNGNYRPEQNDEEEQVEKKGLAALFASSSDVSDSDKAAILVVVLAVLIVVVLVIYLLLLKQRKKKE